MDPGYLKNGYSDDGKTIRKELLLEKARELGEKLSSNNNISQFRKFYDQVVVAKDIAEKDFLRGLSMLYEIDAPLAASVGRGNASEELYNFFHENLEAVKNANDVDFMFKHLRAVLGYMIYFSAHGRTRDHGRNYMGGQRNHNVNQFANNQRRS